MTIIRPTNIILYWYNTTDGSYQISLDS